MSDTPAADAAVEFTEELEEDIWTDEPAGPSLIAKMAVEVIGTFVLVLMGVGAAILAGTGDNGTLTVGLSFGVAVIICAFAFAAVSGAHFNPAITVGVWLSGRFPGRDVVPYILAQVIGGLIAGTTLYLVLQSASQLDGDAAQSLMQSGANGFAEHAPIAAQGATFGLAVALLVEVIATGLLVLAVLGTTSRTSPKGVAPFAIGLALALLLVFSIPFTNGALNPARASGAALFAGDWALTQLWVFWVAPLVGGAIVGLLYRAFGPIEDELELIETIEVIEA